MKRGSTLPITITVYGVDLSSAEWIIVSFKQRFTENIEFDQDHLSVTSDGENTVIVVQMTEKQSVNLKSDEVTVDVNWMIDGVRNGAVMKTVNISDTLLKRVVANE